MKIDGNWDSTEDNDATDDVNYESLLILLNPDFRNPLMLCKTYQQVTIIPIRAFL